MSEVHRRIIRDADTGKLIDDCSPDDVSDEKLYRRIPEKRNLRIELVMKDDNKVGAKVVMGKVVINANSSQCTVDELK